jgi:hypothetical protein
MTEMASHAINDAGIQFGPALLRFLCRFLPFVGPAPDQDPDDARARRAFLMEMLDRNPDAFASEQDVQSMMRLFTDQF